MPQPNGTISRKGAKAAKKKACHFDEREKPFLRSLAFCSGMTGPSLCVLGVLARVNFQIDSRKICARRGIQTSAFQILELGIRVFRFVSDFELRILDFKSSSLGVLAR
jgi:hypothetical protein